MSRKDIFRYAIIGAVTGAAITAIAPGLSSLQIVAIIFAAYVINGIGEIFA